jgi:DNA-binding NarL/FixJ family response regulator
MWCSSGCPGCRPHNHPLGMRNYDPWEAYGRGMPIRVVLGEDNLLVREGLRSLLSGSPSIEVINAAGDYESLRVLCEHDPPDVVVTDVRMPPTKTDEGIRLAGALRESHPEIGVVVLSQFSAPVYALALFEHGADRRAYLLKDRVHNRGELTAAIHAVAEGGSLVDPKIVEELAKSRARAENNPLKELTAREHEVLTEIAQGKSNLAIAQSLYLSKRAIEKHINMIFIKLGLADAEDVSRRVKAVLLLLAQSDEADQD